MILLVYESELHFLHRINNLTIIETYENCNYFYYSEFHNILTIINIIYYEVRTK